MSVLLSCVLSRVRAWGNLRVPSRIKHTASCPEIIKSKPQWEGSLLPCFTVCTFRQCLSMNVKDLTHLWLYRTITVTTHRNLTSLGQWGSLFWDSFMGAWLVKWDGLSQHPRTARHREMSALTIQPSDSSLSGPRVCLNLCCILYIFTNVQHSFCYANSETFTVLSWWRKNSYCMSERVKLTFLFPRTTYTYFLNEFGDSSPRPSTCQSRTPVSVMSDRLAGVSVHREPSNQNKNSLQGSGTLGNKKKTSTSHRRRLKWHKSCRKNTQLQSSSSQRVPAHRSLRRKAFTYIPGNLRNSGFL